MKKIFILLSLILLSTSISSCCTKDEVEAVKHYNNRVQSVGSTAFTENLFLQGTKGKRIDGYTGNYKAEYKNFPDTRYLFGRTSIERNSAEDTSGSCTLEITDGISKVFWIAEADDKVNLIETSGTYRDEVTLPDGNYIGIECEDFTGKIKIKIE